MFSRFFKHKHKWQTRGVNKWGLTTYRFCLKCGERQERINKSNEEDKFIKCNPIPHLDEQFDKDNNYII